MGLPQRLAPVARWVSGTFRWLLPASYLAAAVLPGVGLWLAHATLGQVTLMGEPTWISLPMLLPACLLANAGLDVRLGQLHHRLRRPGPLLVGLAADVLVPAVFIVCIAQEMRL